MSYLLVAKYHFFVPSKLTIPKEPRSMSNSSSDVPLVQQKATGQRPSSSSSNEPSVMQRKPSNAMSRVTSTANKQSSADEPTAASDASARGRPSTRGATSATRGGRGAVRGGSGVSHRNVFQLASASKRERSNLLANAEDVTKKPKQFTNMRLQYIAQKQGRDKAEAAPDISSLPGGLFNPSTLASVQPVRPGNLRKSSSSANNSPGLFVDDEADDIQSVTRVVPVPNYQAPSSNGRLTCYYWDKQQRNENAGPCMRGVQCDFLHAYRDGVQVALPPPERLSAINVKIEETCYFWNRQQQDKSLPSCNKGDDCSFLHEHRPGVPVAPPPPGVKSFAPSDKPVPPPHPFGDADENYSPTIGSPGTQPQAVPRPPWDNAHPFNAVCYAWLHGTCNETDESCDYYHSKDKRLPIGPEPSSTDAQLAYRAPVRRDVISTCYYWDRHERNNCMPPCKQGGACNWLHEYRPGVPISAGPDDLSTCFYWDKQQQDPSMPACTRGEACVKLHEYRVGVPVAGPPPSYREPRQPAFSSSNCVPLLGKKVAQPFQQYGVAADPEFPQYQSVLPPQDMFQRHFANGPENQAQPVEDSALQAESQTRPALEQHLLVPSSVDRPQWEPRHGNNAICYFWFNEGYCKNRGHECLFQHSHDRNLPVAPKPTSWNAQTQQTVQTPQSTRPPWDPNNPRNAICWFFNRSGHCKRENSCWYYHKDDETLPVAPAPNSVTGVCRQWLAGYCPVSDCRFAHERTDSDAPMMKLPALPVRNDDPSEAPTALTTTVVEPRVRSVKFADELEDIPPKDKVDQPKRLSDAQSISNPPDFRPVCRFWLRGECQFGSSCRNRHSANTSLTSSEHMIQPPAASRRQSNSGALDAMDLNILTDNKHSKARQQDATHEQSMAGFDGSAEEVHPVFGTSPIALPKAKRKLKLDDYKRNKTLKALGSRAKEVIFGTDETRSQLLDFGDINSLEPSQWKDTFTETTKIMFTQMCMAQDFKSQRGFLQRRQLLQGFLVSADQNNVDTNKALGIIADELTLRSAGLVSAFKDFAILIYPAKKEEWRFLEEMSDYPSEIRLRFFIFQWDMNISQFLSKEPGSGAFGQPYRMAMVERLHGLELKNLLPNCQAGQNPYNFFLMFPATAKQSEDFVTAWIKSANPESKIHSSRHEGSWNFFTQTPTIKLGVVLVHESAAPALEQLPSLFAAVNRPLQMTLAFWFVSDSDSPYPLFPSRYSEEPPVMGRIRATRLFPRGCAFLVTPSFLVAEPQKAYDLFKWFLEQPKPKYLTTTPRSWKLVAARRLSNWLLDLAIAKAREKDDFEAKNHDKPAKDAMLKERGLSYDHCELRFKLHGVLRKLDKKKLLEPSSDSEAGFHSDSEEPDRPFVYASKTVNPDDEPALINWFAGWSVCHLDRYRKFVVIGTDPSSASRAMRTKEVAIKKQSVPTRNFSPFRLSKKTDGAITTESPPASLTPKEKAPAIAAKLKASAPITEPSSTNPQDSDTVMVNGVDSPRQSNGEILPGEIVQFIALTGGRGSIDDAKKFLAGAQNDIIRAIKAYKAEDINDQVDELISTEGGKLPSSIINLDANVIPPQVDAIGGGSTSSSSSRPGILTSEDGQRFIPRSIQASDNRILNEIRIQSDYHPDEDAGQPAIHQHPNSREGSVSDSRRGSNANAMDIHSGSDTLVGSDRERVRTKTGKGRWVPDPEMELKEIRFQATTEWYSQFVKERGHGWEHIYIGGWEKAFNQIGYGK